MKVNKLTEIELDYWVAKTTGNVDFLMKYKSGMAGSSQSVIKLDWNDIGKYVQKYKLQINYDSETKLWIIQNETETNECIGKNVLELIKRCIVKREYGEEVDDQT